MEYVKIKGFNISKYTLGTVQLGMKYGIANKTGKPGLSESFNILSTAVQAGVNSFDTSLHYEESEKVLGMFFAEEKNLAGMVNKPVITTKFKTGMEEGASPVEIEKKMRECAGISLEHLKINKIPVYLLHDPKELYKHGKILADVMKRLKDEGIIEIAGASVYTCEEACEVLKYDVYEAIQLPINAFDSRFIKSGVLKKLQDAGMLVFARTIFLQGLFFLDPAELKGNLADAGEYLVILNKLAEREGISTAQLALSYIRDMDGITSLVVGAETAGQVKENITLMNGPAISEKTRNEMLNLFENVPLHVLVPSMWKLG
ncbi:MAG: aldo/keto reductase [Clostridiaceae bacterium]|nr:aldo/keto reductase [Clostridiaceae bacterium]